MARPCCCDIEGHVTCMRAGDYERLAALLPRMLRARWDPTQHNILPAFEGPRCSNPVCRTLQQRAEPEHEDCDDEHLPQRELQRC